MATRRSDEHDGPGLAEFLSALLVAFTIEFDNEFEHRMPHRTTRHGRTAGAGPRPWLISMAIWVDVMRLVPEDGISVRDLVRRSQLTPKSMQGLVKRVGQWWGYLELRPDPAERRGKPPASGWVVRPTKAGREAQSIWAPLTDEIEARWNDRFGEKAVDDLRAALTNVVARLDVDLPDYLLGEPRLSRRQPTEGATPLAALLSKVLLALALDFDNHSNLSLEIYTAGVGSRLPICANVLRLIGDDGVAVAKIAELSGVDKMSIDNWVSILAKCGYIEVATDSSGRRRRVARLTPKGVPARDAYFQWTDSVESRWPDARSAAGMRDLRRAAEKIVGNLGPGSLLWKGMEPYPDGWRSQVAPRQVLPHFPAVSARGGFPDGS